MEQKIKKTRHYYVVDMYRFIFTIGVMLMHFEGVFFYSEKRVFEGFYLAVEFFFILSGYLLLKSYETGKYASAFEYTKTRFGTFVPYNLILLILILLRNMRIVESLSIKKCFMMILESVPEAVFLQTILPTSENNVPIWYVSVLMIVGFVLFYIYDVYKVGNIYVLVILTGLYGYLFQTIGNLDIHGSTTQVFKISFGILRGGCGMALGMVGCRLAADSECRKSKLLRLILFICISGIILFFSHSKLDFVCVLLMTVFIINEFLEERIKEPETSKKMIKNLCKHLGELSLAVYFSHWYIIMEWWNVRQVIYKFINVNMWVEMILFTLAVVVFSECLHRIIKRIKN